MTKLPWAAARQIPSLGALGRWHQELREGRRQNTGRDYDALHAAAVWELNALQLEASGDHGRARQAMDAALLRLHGHFGLDPAHERAKAILQELRSADRRERQARVATWTQRNAAKAKEYAS